MPEIKETIIVEWASKTRKRVLANVVDQITKMLCQGTFKEITPAVWKNKQLKKEVVPLILRDVHKECANL